MGNERKRKKTKGRKRRRETEKEREKREEFLKSTKTQKSRKCLNWFWLAEVNSPPNKYLNTWPRVV
jgi:hypothetical protein